MKLGIGLPNTLTPHVNRTLMLDWAKLSDEAGFSHLGPRSYSAPNARRATTSKENAPPGAS
jgi:hypothetical protein